MNRTANDDLSSPSWFAALCNPCRLLGLFEKDSWIRQTRESFEAHAGEICHETNVKLVAERKLTAELTCPLCRLFYNARTGRDETDESLYCVLGVSFFYGSFSLDRYSVDQELTPRLLQLKDEFCLLVVPRQLFKEGLGELSMPQVQDVLTAYDVNNADPVQLIMLTEDGDYEWMNPRFEFGSMKDHEHFVNSYLPRIIKRDAIDYNLLKTWLSDCSEAHECCKLKAHLRPDRHSPLGLPHSIKLIHCGTREVVEVTHLPRFATLSYVWGDTASRENVDWICRIGEPLPNNVPATIEDAIEVTKSIGIDYIWIDAYCIDQADHFDKISQISMMDKIYALANVTIVAAAGEDAKYGLPGVGRTFRTRGSEYLKHDGFTAMTFPARPESLIRSSRWASRGWTLQEGSLSRRRLVFTDEQVYFECNYSYETEALKRPETFNTRAAMYTAYGAAFNTTVEIRTLVRLGHFGQISSGGRGHGYEYLSPKDDLGMVNAYLHDFMHRELSFVSDRVNAFRGIFRFYKLKDINGLPFPSHGAGALHGLIRNLSWQHSNPWMCTRCNAHPSFSWAGWTGVPKLDFTAAGLRAQGIVRENYVRFLNIDLEWFDESMAELDRIQLVGYTTKIQIKWTNQRARLDKKADFILNRLARDSTKMENLQITRRPCTSDNESRIFDCLLLEESERNVRALLIARRDGFIERIGTLILFTDFYREHDKLPGESCVKETLESR